MKINWRNAGMMLLFLSAMANAVTLSTQPSGQIQLLIVVIAFVLIVIGLAEQNIGVVTAGALLLVLTGLNIFTGGIPGSTQSSSQVQNLTYAPDGSVSSIMVNQTYTPSIWQDQTTNGIGIILILVGILLMLYCGIEFINRRRESE